MMSKVWSVAGMVCLLGGLAFAIDTSEGYIMWNFNALAAGMGAAGLCFYAAGGRRK